MSKGSAGWCGSAATRAQGASDIKLGICGEHGGVSFGRLLPRGRPRLRVVPLRSQSRDWRRRRRRLPVASLPRGLIARGPPFLLPGACRLLSSEGRRGFGPGSWAAEGSAASAEEEGPGRTVVAPLTRRGCRPDAEPTAATPQVTHPHFLSHPQLMRCGGNKRPQSAISICARVSAAGDRTCMRARRTRADRGSCQQYQHLEPGPCAPGAPPALDPATEIGPGSQGVPAHRPDGTAPWLRRRPRPDRPGA
jgi:hypothetical protein